MLEFSDYIYLDQPVKAIQLTNENINEELVKKTKGQIVRNAYGMKFINLDNTHMGFLIGGVEDWLLLASDMFMMVVEDDIFQRDAIPVCQSSLQ